jgi:DUF1009 family protein
MTMPGKTLGIIVGAGDLPIAIAHAAQGEGRAVFLLGLEGVTDPNAIAPFPHGFVGLGEVGRAVKLLREADCSEITFAGKVSRVEFSKLKLDAKGVMALPRIMAAAMKGDDALLRALLAMFEREGLRVVGSADVARGLLAPLGPVGKLKPGAADEADILQGARVVQAMGALDIGQAAVVCRGLVLAVEAAEGTDAMLARVASLPETLRGTPSQRKGVMVKTVKPHQERRVDLPVVAARTVDLVAAAGLAGLAIQAGGVLLVDREKLAATADRLGVFVHGFKTEASPRE